MSRHFWRACNREAGFSFVELLVTIIIAGIAFAAIVPMFIQAQGKNSSDLYRQAALNAGQDRVERIRSLDFSALNQPNLETAFGTTAPVMNNSSRMLTVGYSVAPKAGTTLSNTPYKVVTVTVTWTAPPKPVKPVIVQTVVYRQYAGPTLATFWTTPAIGEDGVIGDTSVSTIKFSAIPSTAWKGQQTQSVQYQVWNENGALVAAQLVFNTSIPAYASKNGTNPCGFTSTTSEFWWNWDSAGAIDGTYSVSATAASALTGSYQGPTERFFFKLKRNITVAAPADLAIQPGATQASLTWTSVNNATSYKVYRATAAGGPFTLVSSPVTAQFNDTGLASSTDYWYEVSAVSSNGESARSAPVMVHTLVASTDTSKPTVPTWATPAITHDVAGQGVIELRWNASTDTGGAGLGDYRVWRSDNGSTGWTVIATWTNLLSRIYDDTVGPGATKYYRVTARDAVLNESDPSTVVSATTNTSTSTYSLTLTNTNNGASKDRYVWVQLVSSGDYYSITGASSSTPAASGTLVASKSGTAIFNNLPGGKYNIWVSASSPYSTASVQTSATINNANLGVNIN